VIWIASHLVHSRVQETQRLALLQNNSAACPAQVAQRNLTSYMGRSCIYESVYNWLNVDADAHVIEFQHSLMDSGDKPTCVVRRFGDTDNIDLAMLDPGQARANLSQWLAWAGVDLDKELSTDEGLRGHRLQPNAAGKFPKLRSTGLDLTVRILYYNYGLAPGSSLSTDVTCVIEV
jgi:hypothetical protein